MGEPLFDICIIGSGAGGGPVAFTLARAGKKVVVLEKGPWFKTADFTKDEMVAVRRSVYTPNLKDEPQVLETQNSQGEWIARSNYESGRNLWNGNVVGGSTNFMSGYFHRLKPVDFRLVSEYGPIAGANVSDWPISYQDLEPFYDLVEKQVGVSGRVVEHDFQEPRSSRDFPMPPLAENPVTEWMDKAAARKGYPLVPIPRAILSRPKDKRYACYYSNYCGSYGCGSDAKGSSRIALLADAMDTGNCTIIPYAKAYRLETDGNGKVKAAWYHGADGQDHVIRAKCFVVAAQAIETSRLLLMSHNPDFPNGLANNQGQVGKNLLFSAGGTGSGHFYYKDLTEEQVSQIRMPGVFVNRSIHQWYEIDDPSFGSRSKGGVVDFLFEHANASAKAIRQKWDEKGKLVYGSPYKEKLKAYFTGQRRLKFEVFVDWLPTDDCFITLDPEVKDKWGDPVARIRLGYHPHDLKVGNFLAGKAEELLNEMGANDIASSISGGAPSNLQAGGCRFGTDPLKSVLNPDCRAHEVENLYVTDGSFMPTGGSVTYTWTIYANAFRVAGKILEQGF